MRQFGAAGGARDHRRRAVLILRADAGEDILGVGRLVDQRVALIEQWLQKFGAIVVAADDNSPRRRVGLRDLIGADRAPVRQGYAAAVLQLAPQRAARDAQLGEAFLVE